MNERKIKNDFSLADVLVPHFAVSFFFAIYVPFLVYMNNIQEFLHVRPWALFGVSVCVFAVLFLAGGLLLLLIKKSHVVLKYVLAIMSGLAVAFYVQGNLINLDYGILDGRKIPWDEMIGAGIINTLVWVAILIGFMAFAFWGGKKFFYRLKVAMLCFFLYIALILVMRSVTFPAPLEYPVVFTEKDMTVVSANTNVVVIVLDSFDQVLMAELLDSYPECKEKLRGFTYYKNTIGCFSYTFLALPQIITGIPAESSLEESSRTHLRYVNEAYENSAIMKALQENNFTADIYGPLSIAPAKRIFGSSFSVNNIEDNKETAAESLCGYIDCINSSMFIYLPHFLKRFHVDVQISTQIRRNGNKAAKWDAYQNEMKMISYLEKDSFLVTSGKRFKFFHFFGTHLPEYNIDKAKACIDYVSVLVGKIREVSPDSKFIVLADHGVTDRARPIFLCSNGSRDFKISDIPFSYSDLSSAFVDAINGEIISPKESLGNRRYIYADGKNYVTNYYNLTGELSLPTVYKNVYTGKDRLVSGGLEWDVSGNSTAVWTIGHDAFIRLPVVPNLRGKRFDIKVTAMALLGEKLKRQEVQFYIGDNHKKKIIYDLENGTQNQTIEIPVSEKESKGTSFLDVRLKIKYPIAPMIIDSKSNDPRPLGILISRIELTDKRNLTWDGMKIDIGRGGDEKISFVNGFADVEFPYGRWNDGLKSKISFSLDPCLNGSVVDVIFYCHPFLAGGKIPKQRMKVSCVGKVLLEKSFSKEGVETFKVRLPAEVTKRGRVILNFEFPDCVSPKDLGMSEDPRRLAVFFRTCEIRAVER